VIIHPLADHRRLLHIDKLGTVIEAHPNFLLVISYNPGYQSALKDLKHSTRQRFVAVEFTFPPKELEAPIIAHESGVELQTAESLALLGEKIRNLRGHGLQEGVSTRLLVYAGRLVAQGIEPRRAAQVSVVWGLTDDADIQRSVAEVVASIFP
jgi:nitric oxide reductase NorQ protein